MPLEQTFPKQRQMFLQYLGYYADNLIKSYFEFSAKRRFTNVDSQKILLYKMLLINRAGNATFFLTLRQRNKASTF